MAGTSKILTVSYGTFSCTLEGFDDPFSAMREIADYFRDLAASDRYFGAEPPKPDPQAMAERAQRDSRRHVTAQLEGGAISLHESDAPEQNDASVPPATSRVTAAQPNPLSAAPAPSDDGDVAAKMLRLRAAASRSALAESEFEDQPAAPLAFAPISAAFSDARRVQPPIEAKVQPAAAEVLDPLPPQREEPGPIRLVRARLVKRHRAEALAAAQGAAAATPPKAAPPLLLEPSFEVPLDFVDDPELILAASEAAWASFDDYVDPADVVFATPLEPVAAPAFAEPAAPFHGAEDLALAARLEAIRSGETLYDPPELPVRPVALAASDRVRRDPAHGSSISAPEPLELREALRVNGLSSGEEARLDRPVDEDASVSRILRETNSQLDDSEASRRRSTIAHLKAAVAATRADREDGVEAANGGDEIDRYRDDLQRVVRQHRTETGSSRRLAPLMLISELRVDAPNASAHGAATGNLALADAPEPATKPPASSFAEFAEQMGANGLPDLLEAAAAYAAFVEGRPHVSRPQLMDWAMSTDAGSASREDGLRAFGKLLRTGRINKIKRGQFSISEESRFRPD